MIDLEPLSDTACPDDAVTAYHRDEPGTSCRYRTIIKATQSLQARVSRLSGRCLGGPYLDFPDVVITQKPCASIMLRSIAAELLEACKVDTTLYLSPPQRFPYSHLRDGL